MAANTKTPTIEMAIIELASAEAESRDVNATASVVRAKKSSAAVGVIRLGVSNGSDEKPLRSSLLSAGVPKGTASKIITVIRAVREGKVEIADNSSLSGLYALATAGEVADEVGTAPAGPTIVEKIVEIVKPQEYATVEDMVDDLIARFVLSAEDPFAVSGRVLVMLTERIDKAVAPYAHAD